MSNSFITVNASFSLLATIFIILGVFSLGILVGFRITFYLVKKLVTDLMKEFKQTIKSATEPESISEVLKKFGQGLGKGPFRLPTH